MVVGGRLLQGAGASWTGCCPLWPKLYPNTTVFSQNVLEINQSGNRCGRVGTAALYTISRGIQ